MKNKNISDYVIAGLVIGCSVILLFSLTIALKPDILGSVESSNTSLPIDFPTVTGVRMNSEVRFAGKKVGRIVKIRFLTSEDYAQGASENNYVRVIAKITDTSLPLQREQMGASIQSDTLLGEKFIDLYKLSAPNIKPFVNGREVASFDDLTYMGREALDTINTTLEDIRTKDPQFGTNMAVTMHAAARLLERGDKVLTDLENQDPEFIKNLAEMVRNADELVNSAQRLTEKADKLIGGNEKELSQSIKDLHVITQNLKVTSTYAKAITATLAKKPWRVVWGGETPTIPSEETILKTPTPLPIQPPND